MLLRLIKFISALFRFDSDVKLSNKFILKEFEARSDAIQAAMNPGVAAVVRSGDQRKWILLMCPCGCKNQIALNLMKTHTPYWRLEVRANDTFSIYPSVDSQTCGAHFWIKNGQVIWC
jgi:hypothetical protein